MPDRSRLLRWPVLAALAGFGSAALVLALLQRGVPITGPDPTAASAPPTFAHTPTPDQPPAAPAHTAGSGQSATPRFDVARIAPDGQAVIAGRADPGATVTVLDGNRVLGETKADPQGSFVLLPVAPLEPGPRTLHLRQDTATGQQSQGTEELVLVVPPHQPDAAQPPLAVLTRPDAAPTVLQGPPATSGPRSALALSAVDYDAAGDIRFAGTAVPGAMLRIYVDNRPAGTTTANATGNWNLKAEGTVPPGDHRLRMDQVAPDSRVIARAEAPFHREERVALAAAAGSSPSANGSIVVQPGNNLWRLARVAYGAGPRYTDIFAANRTQIRDPNLIYPGQVLTVPAPAGSSTASSSSRSR